MKVANDRSRYTKGFAELISGKTLIVSTYAANSLVTITSEDERIDIKYVPSHKPMGLAKQKHKLAVANRHGISEYKREGNELKLVNIFNTQDIGVRDICYVGDSVFAASSAYSAIVMPYHKLLGVQRVWQPSFITEMRYEDRCHLNGVCEANGVLKYATAFSNTNDVQGWRERHNGVVIDVESGELIATGMNMPHSPRYYRNQLWVCNSGSGGVGVVREGEYVNALTLDGYTRGLAFNDDVLFVGLSRVRETSMFGDLEVTDNQCGIAAIDINTGEVLGLIHFEGAVSEIFAIEVI